MSSFQVSVAALAAPVALAVASRVRTTLASGMLCDAGIITVATLLFAPLAALPLGVPATVVLLPGWRALAGVASPGVAPADAVPVGALLGAAVGFGLGV